ncbi:hypothetical protein [Photobacterium atrarenae]|uniref:Uncharacterized protein n=1 Tax=Photobacterium atrarenae TaxID=865757 RepID=A0ABY5GIB4_9GAMM|nr:hypothetical protein [Photobacterium atrarenae]UTV29030.1 hypothetical protein NNL38_07310 [Photobacterium atrarenae]
MKVMVIVKASPSSEAGSMPNETLLTAMSDDNQKLVRSGIMSAGERLPNGFEDKVSKCNFL